MTRMNYHFPADIPSAVSDAECRTLHSLAQEKVILELGSFYGRSTVVMAQSADRVYSIDTHKGDDHTGSADTYPSFKDNLVKYSVMEKVIVYIGKFEVVGQNLPVGIFDMSFLDGQHDYESVRRDIALMRKVVKPGGCLAFHDYTGDVDINPQFGVSRAVNELAAEVGNGLNRIGTVAWLFL